MTQKRTPTPWEIRIHKTERRRADFYELLSAHDTKGVQELVCCYIEGDEFAPELATAEEIVHAVNNHEPLLRALKLSKQMLGNVLNYIYTEELSLIEQTIANAEKEPK